MFLLDHRNPLPLYHYPVFREGWFDRLVTKSVLLFSQGAVRLLWLCQGCTSSLCDFLEFKKESKIFQLDELNRLGLT